jgi:hypothetical protein
MQWHLPESDPRICAMAFNGTQTFLGSRNFPGMGMQLHVTSSFYQLTLELYWRF